MSQASDDFFDSKDTHPWSRVKDHILASYVTAYLAKIKHRKERILVVDAFAGPGVTEDGEPGSPLIISRAAENNAQGRYRALLVNNKLSYHLKLKGILTTKGLEHSAIAVHDDGPSYLSSIARNIMRESVLLYVDPFGLECEFPILEPFLNRPKIFSTDILINLQMPIVHRLAARDATNNGKDVSDSHSKFHEKLTRTFGGDYWKDCLFSDEETFAREQALIEGYKARLASTGYLTYTGACPIQERQGGVTKYYVVFASRHPDAMNICNDAMCKAVNEYFRAQEIMPLFADLSWQDWRNTKKLEKVVVQFVERFPSNTRKNLWVHIIQDNFMQFVHSEYTKSVTALVKSGKIICSTPVKKGKGSLRTTKRLNDNCVLEPINNSH